MTIYTDPARVISGLSIEDYQAPLGDYLRARAGETFTRNPLPSLLRSQALDELEGDVSFGPGREALIRKTGRGEEESLFLEPPKPEDEDEPDTPLTPFLSPLEAGEKYGHLGLTFDRPVRQAVADELARRKLAERRRQSIISRRGDFGAGAAGLGLDLLVSVADPLNVASAFIPVIGQARFASMVARLGAGRARFTRGAIEGAVGAAVVEPIVLMAAIEEQADYNHLDSLLNLAFGSILGGGLHLGGGFVADVAARATGRPTLSDRIAALSPEVREAAGRVALAQTLEGRAGDVDPVIRAAEEPPPAPVPRAPEGPPGPEAPPSRRPESAPEIGTARPEGRPEAEPPGSPFRQTRPFEVEGTGITVDLPDELHARLWDYAVARRGLPEAERRGKVDAETRRLFDDFKPYVLEDFDKPADVNDLAEDYLFLVEEDAGGGRRRRVEAPPLVDPELAPDYLAARGRQLEALARGRTDAAPTPEDIADFAARQENPEQLTLPDFDAARQAEREVAEAPARFDVQAAEAELAEAETLLGETADALGIDRAKFTELAEADAALDDAKGLARAVRAAGLCQTRS